MSGDVQPRKRKDKKRKKDDEDAVKETPGGKQPSAGAAQAATQPGDVQMHVHSDHGTGGHWCAKVVFFILLAGLGALIGLILLENRGISDVDTPLSESRYAEYFSGWVDENHEDDHHHEDILNAINQLDDHGDDGDDNGHGDDDGHGDEDEEHGDDDENGAPYAEEDDHDDENGGGEDDDDDEDEEPMKLDDDEVEEIVATEKKVARQEAAAASDDDDDDDEGDNDDEDDNNNDDTVDNDDDENDNDNEDDDDDDQVNDGDQEDDDDDEDEDQNEVDDQVVDDNDDDDDDDADDEDDGDDDDDDNEAEPAIATQDDDDDNDDNDAQSDDNDEDDDDQGTVTEDKEDGDDDNDGDEDDDDENEPAADQQQQQQDDDDDNDDGDDKNDADIKTADDDEDDDDNEQPDTAPDDGDDVDDDVKLADADDNDADDKLADVDGDDNDQDDDDDNAPFEEEDDNDDDDDDGQQNNAADEEDETEKKADDDDEDDEDDDNDDNVFENFVDNDDGEEEYLAKVKQEQEQQIQQKKQQEQEDSREETSLTIQILVGAALIVAAHLILKPPRSSAPQRPTAPPPKSSDHANEAAVIADMKERLTQSECLAAAVLKKTEQIESIVSPAKASDLSKLAVEKPLDAGDGEEDHVEIIEGHVILIEDDEGEEEEYDDGYEVELEEIDEEEEEQDEDWEEQKRLEEEEREIGSFVPTTFEEFSSMYRSPESKHETVTKPHLPINEAKKTTMMATTSHKQSPLMKKKPPKGAVNKLIYGLHKAPIFSEKEIPSRPSASETYEEELERARKQLDELKNPKLALEHYESLLDKHPRLVPAMVGKARALDLLAEQRQSNAILEDAIESYLAVVSLGDDVDDETLVSVAERCIERVRFRGQHMKAVEVHQALIHRFEAEPRYRNQLAVTYLLSNRLAEAKAVLHETLMRWIEDGFALVHYGFVLKNLDKDMEQAAQYLQEGIDTGHPGTQDGRFYFHLGDALQRLGRQQEALDVYQRAAEKKLFPSMYQRSLYNVGCLQSRPFWTIEQTTFAGQLELIRSQWAAIRDEGLKLLNSVGSFRDEAENLRDTGDWKQFELFARGQRIEKNCARAPLTCKLVEQFTAARSCKRGQVKFSVMHPGTHVWPHCGPTNCRIRAHLGLKVPSSTFIRVATETRSWENGKWLIFDDSFEHEVWHNGTSTRLVLIVDFWHPDLTDVQRKSLNPI
ncbi:aspartyl/asparaginyl beta-hydroxylase isoform X2 [Toxorhynchites rutilus septentrionalis]|uniref:aspartyl/asparaginyl beta-hydroxylase isoform X2 n=1 Tax=Toxorhynchites rutilus septentrionalis TaxID=329112 RepID=UPI002478F602|nr:aspartyl/asparaginyl beta-hydroxylase isoform X2 [Toxorhynchites rutilus septentrionalis]